MTYNEHEPLPTIHTNHLATQHMTMLTRALGFEYVNRFAFHESIACLDVSWEARVMN